MSALVTAYLLVACAIGGYMLRIRLIDRALRRRAAAMSIAEAAEHSSHRLRSAA